MAVAMTKKGCNAVAIEAVSRAIIGGHGRPAQVSQINEEPIPTPVVVTPPPMLSVEEPNITVPASDNPPTLSVEEVNPPSNAARRTKGFKCKEMPKYFRHGQRVRYRRCDRVGTYNSLQNSIITLDGVSYYSFSSLADNNNGWKECEYEKSPGVWETVDKLRIPQLHK